VVQHRLRLRQLVVDVDHQLQVDGCRRQLRVIGSALDQRDVRDLLPREPLLEELQHLRLNVIRVHAALRSDAGRQFHRDEPGTGADVGDRCAFRNVQDVQRDFRRLFVFALAALEPIGRLPSHDGRNLSSADRVHAERLRRRERREQRREQTARDRAGCESSARVDQGALPVVNSTQSVRSPR
jgi:hypothetical protein